MQRKHTDLEKFLDRNFAAVNKALKAQHFSPLFCHPYGAEDGHGFVARKPQLDLMILI